MDENENEGENKIEFLAIGDTVVDAFIKLKKAEIIGEPDTPGYEIAIPFAEKVEYEDVFVIPAVGNAANAAISAARLGLATAIVTNLGDDRDGEDCLAELKRNNVGTGFVKTNKGKKTNYHYVLWYGPERTILIKHQDYDYTMPEVGSPKWIYFSSVNETAFPFHYKIADYLEAHPEINFAFQPGKFEIKMGYEKMARFYKRAQIFFCNVEEAERILGVESIGERHQNPRDRVKGLLQRMHDLGPQTVVITDGPNGAYAYDGKEFLYLPIYPDPKPPYSRTGAGDAFASTTVAATALGKSLPEALAWAGINSMAVVQKVGANVGLLTQEKIIEYLKKAPENYKAEKI